MPRFGNFHSGPLVDFVHVCEKIKAAGWDFVLGLWTAGLGKLLGHDKPLGGAISQVPRRVERAWTRSRNLLLVFSPPHAGSVTLSKGQDLSGL